MLKLQFRDRRREPVWLVDQTFSIGKAPSNSLMINDDGVEDHHLEIVNEKDRLFIINSAQSTSLLLNGKPVPRKASLKADDIITIGTIELELIDPKSFTEQHESSVTTHFTNAWSIYSKASWLEQNRFIIKSKIIIGRDPSCDITLPLEHLSRKHLSLELKNNQLFIEDLDSSNGTYLNGKRVKEAQVNNGDKIKLDVVTFEVHGPKQVLDPNKTIIRNIPETSNVRQLKPSHAIKSSTKEEGSVLAKAQQKKAVILKSKIEKKRLSAEGKQEWLSGENQIKKKQNKHLGKILIVSVVILLASFFLLQ